MSCISRAIRVRSSIATAPPLRLLGLLEPSALGRRPALLLGRLQALAEPATERVPRRPRWRRRRWR